MDRTSFTFNTITMGLLEHDQNKEESSWEGMESSV